MQGLIDLISALKITDSTDNEMRQEAEDKLN